MRKKNTLHNIGRKSSWVELPHPSLATAADKYVDIVLRLPIHIPPVRRPVTLLVICFELILKHLINHPVVIHSPVVHK